MAGQQESLESSSTASTESQTQVPTTHLATSENSDPASASGKNAKSEFLEETERKSSKKQQRQLAKKSSKSQRKSERQAQLEQEVEEIQRNENRDGLRTATDVIKRIKWDSSCNLEEFSVGYLDRFIGIIEEQFDTFNWEDDLASLSPEEDDLAIPKHRIQYFKYKNTIVWDKRSRLDNIFGSCGGKKFEQLLLEEEEENRRRRQPEVLEVQP